MNENAKNLAIYNAIAEVANGVFAEMEGGKYGTFTAKEVQKNLFCGLFFKDDFNGEEMKTIEVENFSCEFPMKYVFQVLYGFEHLVKASERKIFVREMNKGEKVLEFDVPKNMPKLLKNLAEEYKGVTAFVCLDINLQALVATNGYTVNAQHVDVKKFVDTTYDVYVIHRDAFKKADKVVITKTSDANFANGVEIEGNRFPNWSSIIPEISTNQAVVFKKWSDFTKALKDVEKLACEESVNLIGSIGCNSIKVASGGIEKNIALREPLKQEIDIVLNVENTLKMLPSKILYIKNGGRVIVGVAENSLTFCLPIKGEMPDQTDVSNIIDIIGETLTKNVCETKEEKTETIVKNLPAVIVKNLPVPIAKNLPAVVEKIEPKVMEEIPTPQVEEIETVEAEEIVMVNGMCEGDYVEVTLPFGDKIIGRIYHFSKNKKKVSINLKGWNKFSFNIENIAPTTATKNTMPEWLTVGSTITNGEIIGTIAKIERSKIVFEDETTATLKDVLVTFHPCEKPQEIVQEIVEETKAPEPVRMPKKSRPFGWLRRVLNKVALLSF